MQSQSVRPAVFWYWVAGVLLAGTVALGVLAGSGFGSLERQIRTFQRVRVPGQAKVTFSQPGHYLLYFESPSAARTATSSVWVVLPPAQGRGASLGAMGRTSETYSLGGHFGRSIATVTIVTPGRYVLTAGLPDGQPPADIAVGRGLGHNIVGTLIPAGGAVVLALAALATWLITFLRRRGSRRAIQLADPPGGWLPAGGSAPPGGALPG
jgi:hypothetical protein